MARRFLLMAFAVVAAVAGGRAALAAAGVDASPAALQAWVLGYGVWGPLALGVLIALRHFLFLPSTVMLTLGGAVLGIAIGGLVGSIGLLISAAIEFWIFRFVRPDNLIAKMEARSGDVAIAVERGTPLAVLASTAIPPLPMTFFYWAASLTSMSFLSFTGYAFVGGVVRAFMLSLLGAGLIAADLPMILAAVALCVALAGFVFASPRMRRLLLPPKSA